MNRVVYIIFKKFDIVIIYIDLEPLRSVTLVVYTSITTPHF